MKKKKTKNKPDIQIESILLKNRQLFLDDVVNTKTTSHLIKTLLGLDYVNHNPITLYINSPGGSITAGLSIIDTMQRILSPIITVITGYACSMRGLISIVGDERHITPYGIWMAHPPTGGGSDDYFSFQKDRVKFRELLEKYGNELFKNYTNLSKKEIKKTYTGELWLTAEECLEKGIVDRII